MATPKQIAQDLERWDNGDGTNSVRVVNKDGSVISAGGGGGTSSADKGGFTEGTSTFTPSGGVFNDGLLGVTSGLAAWFRITAFRALHVNLRDSSGNEVARNADGGLQVHVTNGGGGASSNDSAAFTAGTTAFTPIGGDFDDTPPTAITTAHAATARITANRALHANLRNQAGTELGTAAAPVRTDPTGTTAQPTNATITTDSVGLAKDATLTGGTARTKITDGTNNAAVKAASTAAIATDPSVVVALSPNSPVPAGTNIIGKAGIDQTTPGTTDSVTVATGQGAGATIGVTTGLAVTTDVAGTLQQYLRGLAKAFLANITFTAGGALKSDITTVAGTAPTTVGKLDVKGADGDLFVRQATAANLNAQVVGPGAQGAAVTGNPLRTGRRAATANPTAVTDGQNVDSMADKLGRTAVAIGHVRDQVTDSGVITVSTTTETTLLAAAGAGVLADLTAISLANTSATAVRCDVRDVTAGTVRWTFEVPASGTAGLSFTRPLKQTTANSAWTVQLASAVTDVRVCAQFEKNA